MTAGLSGWTKIDCSYPAVAVMATGPLPDNLPKGRKIIVKLAGAGVLEGLAVAAYPDFGLYIWRTNRFFLSVRCGPIGQDGNGGHAHNDQLAIELNIDGLDWLADPGSYAYTPSPAKRDAYRSVMAHAAPRLGGREPALLNQGMFCLEDKAKARCLRFDKSGFVGVHYGFNDPVYRSISIGEDHIMIADSIGEDECLAVSDAAAIRKLFPCLVPFSPGYGEIL